MSTFVRTETAQKKKKKTKGPAFTQPFGSFGTHPPGQNMVFPPEFGHPRASRVSSRSTGGFDDNPSIASGFLILEDVCSEFYSSAANILLW